MSERKKRKRHRGDGTITLLPSGKHQAKVSGGIDPTTGKRLRLSKAFDTEGDARRWLRKQGSDRDRGGLAAPASAETVAEWVAEWLAEKKATTEPGTHADYASVTKNHVLPLLGPKRLKDLTADGLSKWRDRLLEKGASAATVKKAVVYLAISLNDAVDRGKLAANPAKKVKRPKHTPKEVETFTRDEAVRIVATVRGHRHEPLVRMWLDTGCRTGEAFALHWPEVDLAAGTVKVSRSLEELRGGYRLKEPKTRAGRRTIGVSAETVAALAAHRDRLTAAGRDIERGLVFPNSRGGFLSRSVFRVKVWVPLLLRAKIPYRKPYALRHTRASLFLSGGVSLKAVQRRLGHEDPMVTLKTYAHLMPEDETKSVEALTGLFRMVRSVPMVHGSESAGG